MDLSEDELEFVERYKLEAEHERSLKPERRGRRRDFTKLFYVWIAMLSIAPFLLSGAFLMFVSQLSQFFNNEGIKDLTKNYRQEEIDKLAQEKGFEDIDLYLSIYQHRFEIVAGVFTLFIVLIGVSFMVRILAKSLRKEHGTNEED